MKHDFDRLRCPKCSKYFKEKDKVFLDEINTIIHQRCYAPNNLLSIKDNGTYRNIIQKYYFFKELQN